MKISVMETEHERLLSLGNKQGVVDGVAGSDWGLMGDRHLVGHLMG